MPEENENVQPGQDNPPVETPAENTPETPVEETTPENVENTPEEASPDTPTESMPEENENEQASEPEQSSTSDNEPSEGQTLDTDASHENHFMPPQYDGGPGVVAANRPANHMESDEYYKNLNRENR